jgi:AcrR family transcriptional regulator
VTPKAADSQTHDRIRDAALALFGTRGFDGSSVRDIAQRAGVSPALVIHYFGSKEALRSACDAFLVEEIVGRKEHMLGDGDLASTIQKWLADVEGNRRNLDYLARMIVDGGPAGAQLFDTLVARTQSMLESGVANGTIRATSDPTVRATIIAAYGLMPLLMEKHLGRALGESGLTPELVRRITVPTLELYTHGLYSDARVLDAATSALAGMPDARRGPRSDKGSGDPNQDPDPPATRASDT